MRPTTIISMVASATDKKTRDITIDRILTAIRTGGEKLKGQITQIRNRFEAELAITADRKAAKLAIDALKKQLPAVMWSGTFSQRANNALIQHSGLFVADIDSLGQRLPEIRKKLGEDPHVFVVFLSPSGDGLKAAFCVPADPLKHLASFRAVETHVRELTGIQIDEACKDLARLCFMSYDPDLHVNERAHEIEPLPEPEKPKAPTNGAIDLSERQRIAFELLGAVDWQSETSGFVTCPGKHLHTTGDGERDCRVDFDGVPTVHCFHNSCRGILDKVNHELRSRIGKVEYKHQTPPDEAGTQPKQSDDGEDAIIARLAALPLLEYDRIRKDEAKKLNCRPSILDSLIHARRLLMRPPSETDNLQGTAVKLADVELWPEAVNGVEILDAIAKRFENYVVLPEGAADMLALWCAHTHVFKFFQISPRLNISAPTQECGKTTLRNCASLFCARGVRTDNMTTAVMFRLVSGHSPTILADECDKWLFINEGLLGLICSGHEKGGAVMRCEGDSNELRKFGCYAPFVLAAIGALPSQLHSRSICIRLERAKREEIKKRSRFDLEHVEYETELNRKLARWITDNRERIESCDPKLPEHLFNRIAGNWRPLFTIAEAAAGDWPKRCANALMKLTTREDEAENLRVMLLGDIKEVLTGDRTFSKDLIDALAEMKDRPWPEVCRGKPITERWLARNLGAFGIRSRNIRIGDKQAKGYELADFAEAFERYVLPKKAETPPFQASHRPNTRENPQILSVPSSSFGTDRKGAPYIGKWDAGTDKKGGEAPKGESDDPLNLEL